MKKQIIAVTFIVLLACSFFFEDAHAGIVNAFTNTVEFSYNRTTVPESHLPGSDEVLITSFKKIEYFTSQVKGIGYGRPGTEEFLNANVLVKLDGDKNFYGMDEHKTNSAIFDTFMTAFIYDLKVEIVYYDKKGVKEIIKVTVMK